MVSTVEEVRVPRASRDEQVWELVDAVQKLSFARSVADVQDVVRRAARRLTGADGATFILREGDFCFYADEDAIAPLWKGSRFPMEDCVSGWAMLNRRPVVIDDIYRDPRVPHDAYRPTFVKSLAMVPIRTAKPIGAIGNYWARRHRADDDEVELLAALADSTAVALENVRAYEELERQAHATVAFAFVGDGVFLTDDDGSVLSWNPAAVRITGLTEADTIEKPVDAVIPGWADVAERIPVSDCEAGELPTRETVPLEIGQHEVWLSICGTRFDGGTVYTFRDVTDERDLDELRSNLIATVSHELRTPLAAIYGAAETLGRPDLPLNRTTAQPFLEMISSQVERLTRTLEEILLASRLESGRAAPNYDRCDATEITSETIEPLQLAYPEAEISFLSSGDTEGFLDAHKVGQVLRNLIENAIRYSEGAARVEVTVTREADDIAFVVRDHGVGISPADQARIFEKFYRVGGAGSDGRGGTGLGLYICRELAERMSGTLAVTSVPGQGSTFTLSVPSYPALDG
jgi:PAS domain S-box-containing protein